jgi:hypothetical protein
MIINFIYEDTCQFVSQQVAESSVVHGKDFLARRLFLFLLAEAILCFRPFANYIYCSLSFFVFLTSASSNCKIGCTIYVTLSYYLNTEMYYCFRSTLVAHNYYNDVLVPLKIMK